jgi:hypothetical protein
MEKQYKDSTVLKPQANYQKEALFSYNITCSDHAKKRDTQISFKRHFLSYTLKVSH